MLTLEFPPQEGGIERILERRCSLLDPSEICVITPQTSQAWMNVETAYPVYRTPMFGAYQIPLLNYMFRTLLPLFASIPFLFKKDIAFECGQAFPFPLWCYLIKKLFGISYYVWVHGNDFLKPLKIAVINEFMLRALQASDGIYTNSRFTKDELIKAGVAGNQIHIFRFPVDQRKLCVQTEARTQIREKLGVQNKVVFLTVGRLVKRKGVDKVIRALAKLTEESKCFEYWIVGNGPMLNELQQLTRDLSLQSVVRFFSEVSDDQLSGYYNAADVFVMLSQSDVSKGEVEGLGLVYLEAMACGLPILAMKGGGVSDAVEHDLNGILLEPSANELEVSQALKKLIDSPNCRIRYAEASKQFMADWHQNLWL